MIQSRPLTVSSTIEGRTTRLRRPPSPPSRPTPLHSSTVPKVRHQTLEHSRHHHPRPQQKYRVWKIFKSRPSRLRSAKAPLLYQLRPATLHHQHVAMIQMICLRSHVQSFFIRGAHQIWVTLLQNRSPQLSPFQKRPSSRASTLRKRAVQVCGRCLIIQSRSPGHCLTSPKASDFLFYGGTPTLAMLVAKGGKMNPMRELGTSVASWSPCRLTSGFLTTQGRCRCPQAFATASTTPKKRGAAQSSFGLRNGAKDLGRI